MLPINGYIQIEPVKEGVISSGGDEYKVIESYEDSAYLIGAIIIVEDQFVIKLIVEGREIFFVKEENIIAVKNVGKTESKV